MVSNGKNLCLRACVVTKMGSAREKYYENCYSVKLRALCALNWCYCSVALEGPVRCGDVMVDSLVSLP